MKISAPYKPKKDPGDPEIEALMRAVHGLEPGEAITVEDDAYAGKSLTHSIAKRIRPIPGWFHCREISPSVVEIERAW